MEMESRWSLAVTSGTSVMESRLRRSGTVMWRAVCLWMLLVGVLHAEVTNKDNNPEEVCKWDTFRANCSEGHVIFINSAHYGRIRRGRCIEMEATEQPCSLNVLSYVDKQCGGRRFCDIGLPNRDLELMRSSCSKELNQYLEISYHCQEVYYASDQRCVINQTVPVVSSIGYLANIITDETNRGSSLCPWKIQLQQGQTVHLTLLNFGVYQNVTTSDKGTICHIYAVLKDSFVSNDGPGSLVCGGDVRETLVLTSMAKEVQISMKKLNSPPRDPIYFLIKYEVIGCPEFVKPEGSNVEIISSGLRVTCADSGLGTWEVRCVHGRWEPSVNKSCASPLGKSSDAPTETGLHQGILIVIVIAVAIIISAIIIVVGLFLLSKKKIFSIGDGLLDSPTFDKHGGIVYHTPMLGNKRYLLTDGSDRPMTDIERNYATTLQMRQMVVPSSVMQPECVPSPGGGDIWLCPVHGVRTAGIATGNGSLNRRNMSSFRPRMEHIYEVPTFEVEVNQEIQPQPGEVANLIPEGLPDSPFYHQLDPEGSKEVGRDVDTSSSSPPASAEPPVPQ